MGKHKYKYVLGLLVVCIMSVAVTGTSSLAAKEDIITDEVTKDSSADKGNVEIISADLVNVEGSLSSILEEVKQIRENINSINEELKSYNPRVTEIYSVNNKIKNAYYRPKLESIPNLEEEILSCGFVNAYTGFFDLDWADSYKPEGKQTRALELLGYDLLLDSEKYENNKYNITETPELVSEGTAIMDIYKALHLPQYALYIKFFPNKELKKTNSPAVVGLPSYVHEIDSTRGRTEVFVTRTNKQLYLKKAEKDLNISRSRSNQRMSNGDFIVLLARMMHFYGEPVMSLAEQNALLQVYGAEIPTYLTALEQQSYLYLKARGVLNVELDYRMPLELNNMLDILMCVYDKDSRTDYKKIQVSLDIGDDLIAKGYFPRTVNMTVGDSALEIVNDGYDYSDANYYDYYIQIDKNTRFKSEDGIPVNYLFVPSVPSDLTSEELNTATYLGVVTGDSGKQYYHFAIDKLSLGSKYMKTTKSIFGKSNYIQINTVEATDTPAYIWVEQGGGVYEFEEKLPEKKGIILKRRNFYKEEFPGASSKERINQSKTVLDKVGDALDNLFPSIAANAASLSDLDEQYKKGFGTTLVTFEINNAKSVISWEKNIPKLKVKKVKGNKLEVKLPMMYESYFRASIKRDKNSKNSTAYPAIATIDGEGILIEYTQLEKAGLFFRERSGELPVPEDDDGQILILNTENGRIKINNKTREIVVGNVLYKVKNDNTALFKYIIDKGKSVLYVDFRVAYGWTSNVLKVSITGNGEDYSVDVKTLKSKQKNLNQVSVNAPTTFRTVTNKETVYVVPEDGKKKKSGCAKVVLTSDYSLANWIIFQGIDRTTGLPKDYAFIYYPKEAFKKDKRPKGLQKMRDIVGYSVQADNWVCKVVELSRTSNSTPGKFTYADGLGYLYNLPDWSDFTMNKYLKGDYLLPLAKSSSGGVHEVINANVNYFTGHSYGSRPTYKKGKGMSIKGNFTTAAKGTRDTKVVSAPAGVSALYGGGKRKYYTAGSSQLRMVQSIDTNSNVFYLGTSVCTITKDHKGAVWAGIEFTGTEAWRYAFSVPADQRFYLISMKSYVMQKGVPPNYVYRWSMYNSSVKTEKSTLEDEEDKTTSLLDILDDEMADRFSGFEEFSIEYMLSVIDSSASWVILFTFEVIPYVGIVLVTTLLGISFISDHKVIKLLCSKTIDPVKFLTFGKVTIEEFTFKKGFVGLMLAYISFALILNGNLLRIIQWLLQGYSELTEMLRYI